LLLGARIHFWYIEEQEKDVYDHLKVSMPSLSLEDLRSTRVSLTNDSRTGIQFRFICRIKQLVANRGLTDIRQSSFRNHVRSGVLDSGSDAQFDECLSDMLIPAPILDCIDIQVRVFYSLKSRPSNELEKDHGFIAQKRNNQFEWAERSAEQEVSDCQRFSKYPSGPPLDRTEVLANAIKVQNDQLLATGGINPEKKEAALLSTEVMAFGESIKDSRPKEPDLDKEGFRPVPEYQKKFMEWGTANAKEFHRKFDSRLSHVFNVGRREKLKSDETSCLIISPSYPPSLDMTRRCGIALGQLVPRPRILLDTEL
jgi:hypothetical protein